MNSNSSGVCMSKEHRNKNYAFNIEFWSSLLFNTKNIKFLKKNKSVDFLSK